MKTIFFLTKNFPSTICGVGDYTYELYHRLSAAGYQIKVITSASDTVKQFVNENKIDKDVYPIIEEWDISCIRPIVSLLNRSRADWFCIQYVPYSYNRLGFPFYIILLQFLVKINGVRTGIFFHEISVRPVYHGFKAFITGLTQRFIGYSLWILSGFVLTNNILYENFLRPFRIPILPIPANLYGKNEANDGKIKDSNLKMKLVSFINRCNSQVIEAVAQCVHLDKLNIELTILGGGLKDVRGKVEHYISVNGISENVFFSDKRSKADIAQVLYESDIFLHMEYVSERGEGGVSSKSGVAAAAMAAGLPIISSVGDMTDTTLYLQGENIILIQSPSVEAIRSSIRQLYSNKELRGTLGLNALKTYQQYFSWDRSVKAYITKFENV